MKTMIYLFALVMLIFAGCAKDEMFDQNNGSLELKKAKVPIPMKADFCMTPDMSLPPIHIEGLPFDKPEYYLPGGGWMSGNATHVGKLQMEESPATFEVATFNPATYITELKCHGTATGANGDKFDWDAIMYMLPDKSFTGVVEMSNGTGKLEGATGTVVMIGSGMCWSAEGFMKYK